MSATKRLLTFGFAGLLLTSVAARADLVTNGGFESGFTGWTVVNEAGSFLGSNWFVQSGTTSPASGFSVPAPPGPTHAAMTDGFGPGSHALLQTFMIPTLSSSVVLSFDMFRGNRIGVYFDPNSLDFVDPDMTHPNQQARVDILTAGAGAFDLGGAVVDNVFKTAPGDVLIDPSYLHYTFNITSAVTAGQTYQLRFDETDNQGFFQLGVDNVSIAVTSAVPEPSALFLPATCLALVILTGLRRKHQA